MKQTESFDSTDMGYIPFPLNSSHVNAASVMNAVRVIDQGRRKEVLKGEGGGRFKCYF